MLISQQLPSTHHNPSCDGACTWCWRKERYTEKRVWPTTRSQRKTEGHL